MNAGKSMKKTNFIPWPRHWPMVLSILCLLLASRSIAQTDDETTGESAASDGTTETQTDTPKDKSKSVEKDKDDEDDGDDGDDEDDEDEVFDGETKTELNS